MEENNGVATQSQHTTENEGGQQVFRCSGDCLKCHRLQQEYCSAQKGYENQRILLEMQRTLAVLSGNVEALKERVEALDDSEAKVFALNGDEAVLAAVTQQETEQALEQQA